MRCQHSRKQSLDADPRDWRYVASTRKEWHVYPGYQSGYVRAAWYETMRGVAQGRSTRFVASTSPESRYPNREKIPFPTNSLNAQKGPSKWDCEVYIPPNLRDRPGHRLGNHTTPRLSLLLPAFALFLLALAAVGALISSFPHLEVLRVVHALSVSIFC